MLFNNLGSVAWLQGHYEQARAYMQKGLSLAREINHPRLINNILYELGEVALSAQHYDEAQATFNEVIISATAFPSIRANAHYGLAALWYARKTSMKPINKVKLVLRSLKT